VTEPVLQEAVEDFWSERPTGQQKGHRHSAGGQNCA